MTALAPASEIVEGVLNRTGQALLDGDFEIFLNHFQLPQIIETFEGRQTITNAEDLKKLFVSVRGYHKGQNVDRIVRSCRQAEYKSENSIEGVFNALLFSGAELVQTVMSTFVMLQRHDDIWKISYNMYGVNEDSDFGKALMHAPSHVSKSRTAPLAAAQLRAS